MGNSKFYHLKRNNLNSILNKDKKESETILNGCILNPGHGKILAPDFNFYIQKDKYPI